MACKDENYTNEKTSANRHKNGVTSYGMQDPQLVFDNLGIKKGNIIIDLGCGAGDYSFHAAKLTGKTGIVYPCDKWPEIKDKIIKRAKESEFENIFPKQFDMTKEAYPFKDNIADLCLLVTVLHIPLIKKNCAHIFSQVKRILKPSGVFAIINCKKEEMPFGPPIEMKLSPEETQELLTCAGFFQIKTTDLGCNYMSLFQYRQ